MLPIEFIQTDAHFAIGMLAALACFATFWLYLDAWTGKRESKELFKWLGYAILAVGVMFAAAQVEPAFLGQTVFSKIGWVGLILRGIGYGVLAVGLALDPLQAVPVHTPEESPVPAETSELVAAKEQKVKGQKKSQSGFLFGLATFQFLLPLLSGSVVYLYWRRAYQGLERHLRPVMWAFIWFTGFEVLDLSTLLRGSTDPRLYSLVAPFGPIWTIENVMLAAGAVLLGWWVWQYLTKRLQTQLFIVLTTACLAIFLVTTVSFTFLLMARVQDQAFSSLSTTAKVLDTAIAGQQAQTMAAAEVVAENPTVASAVVAKDHAGLAKLENDFLTSQHQSSLLITNDESQVLLRAEDPSNWGDSVSSDSLVSRALVGKASHGLAAAGGALMPRLLMRSVAPIRDGAGVIIGTVTVGFTVDDAFVDGLKQSTGLSSSIYSGNVRVATTLVGTDGRSRAVGVKETNGAITGTVLSQNKTWSGLVTQGGQSYLAVFEPLRDADNSPVGMLFIGQPQVLLLRAAGRSIELTFLIAVGLLMVAIWPVHLISKSLANQLH